ncbi:hypothetical protein PIB30_084101 [Stylosanthes scabra]|uniref:Uncharacterized protein n=1 Tax=Stylosanthes scabra TaxID=79078 RepID=A0ABU6WSE2_9FABA|nr:hypothetical protein [Stylosanthes scabra]
MITAAPTTDPATETVRSRAPFFGGEELGAPTGGTPMEGPPAEVGIEAEPGASEGEARGAGGEKNQLEKKENRNTSLTLEETRERNTHQWKWFRRGTMRGRQAAADGRTVTGADELNDVTIGGRAARAKMKQMTTPRHRGQRQIGRRRSGGAVAAWRQDRRRQQGCVAVSIREG